MSTPTDHQRQHREHTTTNDPRDESGRPAIDLGSGGGAEAIRALSTTLADGALPDVFVADGQLVHLSRVSGNTAPTGQAGATGDGPAPLPMTATPLTPSELAWLLAHRTYCYSTKRGEKQETSPTAGVLAAVLSQRYWPQVRPLLGIVGSPVLRPDGTLVQTVGYDPPTGLFCAPTTQMPTIPTRPTPEQVDDARRFLLGSLLRDFPFVADADRANHIGLLFAPILRPYLHGALTPFGLISATTQSSGKTLLAEIPGYLYGSKNLVWRKGDDAELEKSITSALHSPNPIMLWDNIAEGSIVASPVLAQLLTGPIWSARMLGSSGAGFTATNNRLWLATGNNIRLGGDMATRTVLVRLDPNDPHPDQRDQTQFGIPHLDTWLKHPTNRATVLRHLLVLVMDWISAGAPRSGHTMRQFTTWAQATGGLLEHHGIGGFLDNLAELRQVDDENGEWIGFLARWHDLNADRPMSARQLCQQAEVTITGNQHIDAWEGHFLTDDNGRPRSAKSIGRILIGHVGRWHGPYVLRSEFDKHAGAHRFRVETRDLEPDADPDTETDPADAALFGD